MKENEEKEEENDKEEEAARHREMNVEFCVLINFKNAGLGILIIIY